MRVLRSLAIALPLALGQDCIDDADGVALLQHAAVKSHKQEPIDESGELGDEGDYSMDGPSTPHVHGPRVVQGPESMRAAHDAEGDYNQQMHDLVFDTLAYSNLGGLGPQTDMPSGILFSNVTQFGPNARPIDLHIDAIDGYSSSVPEKNGMFGRLGVVNMHHGITATFKVRFLDHETGAPSRLGAFHFSINDLDMGSLGGGLEVLRIAGFDAGTILETGSEVITSTDGSASVYTSSTAGNEEDNPTDPMMLTDQQAARTVSFRFPSGMSEFEFSYSVANSAEPFPGHKDIGRHFLFSGMTSLYMCEPEKVLIDFGLCTLTSSNLGGMGPDFGAPEGIKYGNIASIGDNRMIDMEIHALSAYQPFNSSQNGLNGKFGQVNLHADSRVTLEFVFLEAGTNTRFNVEWFYFTIFDMDEGRLGRQKETFEINNQYYVTHYMTETSEIHVYPHFARNDGNIQYSSTTKGFGRDNPTDPLLLDQQQRDRAVTFLMHDINSFQGTFVIAPPRRGGRNFNFAGRASVVYC